MFKCCICGKEYNTKEMAIKCISRCGRECTLSGQFHSKDSIKKPDENRIIYDIYLGGQHDLLHIKKADK